jgi:hypothetical protein
MPRWERGAVKSPCVALSKGMQAVEEDAKKQAWESLCGGLPAAWHRDERMEDCAEFKD